MRTAQQAGENGAPVSDSDSDDDGDDDEEEK